MGDWYLTRDNKWVYDRNAPSPGKQPAVTQMLPVVEGVPDVDPNRMPPEAHHAHGDTGEGE